ncbi:cd9 antigen [Cichlidogyrus casuarinus]|uniref:Cd9 antigen n=1 Tax=Cichlidogyrus casuarinus TaxID=1844966 RepID=A0ABD2QHB9_9PLAT
MSCAGCVRVFMIVFNFLFTLIGFALLAGGLYFFFTETGAQQTGGNQAYQFSYLGYILLAVAAIGCITLLLGILGCCGAFHYSRCILSFYFVLLLLLFAAEVAVGVIAFQNKGNVESYIDSILEQASQHGDSSKIIKFIESKFGCCGYTQSRPDCKLLMAIPTTTVSLLFL